jgi:thiol-disulfide isomerase/thioredoxin
MSFFSGCARAKLVGMRTGAPGPIVAVIAVVAACRAAPEPAPPGPPAAPAALGYSGDATAVDDDCPGAEDGAELIGTTPPEWRLSDWHGSAPLSLAALRGQVVVVRFWTSGCPFCEASMPALQQLSAEYWSAPVTFIGAFHAKPEGSVRDMTAPLELASKWGISFPLALDREWRTLRAWWLDGHHRHATSVTFVIGADGRIAHVHPGPVYHPSDDPAEAKANADFQALRAAIGAALAAAKEIDR